MFDAFASIFSFVYSLHLWLRLVDPRSSDAPGKYFLLLVVSSFSLFPTSKSLRTSFVLLCYKMNFLSLPHPDNCHVDQAKTSQYYADATPLGPASKVVRDG